MQVLQCFNSAKIAILRPVWKARTGSYAMTRKLKVGMHIMLMLGTLQINTE